MAKEIRFDGLYELDKKILDSLDLNAVKRVVQKNGDQLNGRMTRNTKTAFVKGYSMGDTGDSINTEILDGGMTASVGPGTEYHVYPEFGTRRMEPEPYIKPAWEEQKEQFKKDMDKLVK